MLHRLLCRAVVVLCCAVLWGAVLRYRAQAELEESLVDEELQRLLCVMLFLCCAHVV